MPDFEIVDIYDVLKGNLSRIVWDDIVRERRRQDLKWGRQDHDPFVWLTALQEELGEAAEAALQAHFDNRPLGDLRTEMVQVAALAIAFLECLDRKEWEWGKTRFGVIRPEGEK